VKPVRLAREAANELTEAATWYEKKQSGLGERFLGEVNHTFVVITSRPAAFPRLSDIGVGLNIRRSLMFYFPYAVIFVELENEIRILALAHHKLVLR
jgi:plasmid stabilization system protein ParE